jgi:hypothetical protein
MEVPGYGLVQGPWDLRSRVDIYLGHRNFGSQRVLELGTADGYLSFHIEQQGAEVVSHDLGEGDQWDVVPFARGPATAPGTSALAPSWAEDVVRQQRHTMRQLNNAYWLCHNAFGSKARLIHGDIYSLSPDIGEFDVSVFGAILLHLRDPFLALARVAPLTRRTVVVTDALGFLRLPAPLRAARSLLPPQLRRPIMRFMPDWRTREGADGWWRLTPEIVQTFLGVLGFERTEVLAHFQLFKGRRKRLFTVVGHRTVPLGDAGRSPAP